MARMRRINIVIDPELDDRLERRRGPRRAGDAHRPDQYQSYCAGALDHHIHAEVAPRNLAGLGMFGIGQALVADANGGIVF